MHNISPRGFAIALVLLAVIWLILPAQARAPLAIVLILGALASLQEGPSKAIKGFTERFLK